MTATAGRGRRERLRTETTAEIKSVAMGLMAAGGPDAITLRAIAREMGMTANAIYGYFATRDDLVTTLVHDVYTALADTVDAAWEATSQQDAGSRIQAWATAFRDWALANPQGFRLIYGDPVPGYQAPAGGPAPDAARRVCTGLTALAAAAWPQAGRLYEDGDFTWSDSTPGSSTRCAPPSPSCRRPRSRSHCASGGICTDWSRWRSTAICTPRPSGRTSSFSRNSPSWCGIWAFRTADPPCRVRARARQPPLTGALLRCRRV